MFSSFPDTDYLEVVEVERDVTEYDKYTIYSTTLVCSVKDTPFTEFVSAFGDTRTHADRQARAAMLAFSEMTGAWLAKRAIPSPVSPPESADDDEIPF